VEGRRNGLLLPSGPKSSKSHLRHCAPSVAPARINMLQPRTCIDGGRAPPQTSPPLVHAQSRGGDQGCPSFRRRLDHDVAAGSPAMILFAAWENCARQSV